MRKSNNTRIWLMTLFLAGFLVLRTTAVFSQNSAPAWDAFYMEKFQLGMKQYQGSHWAEAAAEFRAAQESARWQHEWTEALYWVILSEMASEDFSSALRDIEDLEAGAPASGRAADAVYHRALAYYKLGYYEEALPLFGKYAETTGTGGESRRAVALYWMGECLYSLGQFDRAAEFFNTVIAEYPGSPRYEASSYRLELIKQKKIEVELLALLKWSHAESLQTAEEYQRREKNWEQTMSAYQRRIAWLLKNDQAAADLAKENAEYRRKLAAAEARIKELETRPPSPSPVPAPAKPGAGL